MNLELIHTIERMANVKIRIEEEDLYVDGGLALGGCIGLTELPDNLNVDDILDLSNCTRMTTLPENLYVDGCLFLSGCSGLTELPESLYVDEWLFVNGCTNLKSNEHYLISEDVDSRSNKAIYKISTGIIKCGCFTGTLDEFEKRVHEVYPSEVYPSGVYREQLDEYIELCRSHKFRNYN